MFHTSGNPYYRTLSRPQPTFKISPCRPERLSRENGKPLRTVARSMSSSIYRLPAARYGGCFGGARSWRLQNSGSMESLTEERLNKQRVHSQESHTHTDGSTVAYSLRRSRCAKVGSALVIQNAACVQPHRTSLRRNAYCNDERHTRSYALCRIVPSARQ